MLAYVTRIPALKLFSFYLVFVSLDAGRIIVNVNQFHSLLSTRVFLIQIFRNLTNRKKIGMVFKVAIPEKMMRSPVNSSHKITLCSWYLLHFLKDYF